MTKIVIDKETEITKLQSTLETLTDDKDRQSVRFAINIINGFKPTERQEAGNDRT